MGDLLPAVADFLAEPGRWSATNPDGIPYRLIEHLWVTAVAMAIAVLIALPPALWLAHHHKAEALASAVVNIGRAIPSFGLIILFWLLADRWDAPKGLALIAALVALAIPPIFTNAYTAIAQVDQATVESAFGQGLTHQQILFQVEVPLGAEVVLAGIRIAMVQVIATVGIGAIVTDGGGLGRFVIDGFTKGVGGHGEVLVGAILLAALVLAAEGTFSLAQSITMPQGLRRRTASDTDIDSVPTAI